MAGAKHTPPTAGPWEVFRCQRPTGVRITVRQAREPHGGPYICALDIAGRDYDRDEANAALLATSPNFLAACTRERDTVSALDWLAAILTVVDGRFGALAGDDPQALHTALQASSALLAELRAAVARAEGREP